MIRSILITKDGVVRTDLKTEEYNQVISNPDAHLWVDLVGDSAHDYEAILRDTFGFHPLAIDDALAETHIPKIDDWDNYIYVVLRGIQIVPAETLKIRIPELDIFLGPNYLVTYHDNPLTVIETIWQLCQRDQHYLSRGVVKLFYHLADELINQYLPVIEQFDEIIDQIEVEVFANPQTDTLNKIFSLKRALLQLRRTILPQREVFNKLARGSFSFIQEHDQVYFRDLYDHMARLQEINESLRDLVSGALDSYLSAVNNRMNEIMKTLTVITTLFMPLSFLTGFFGMNFFQAALQLDIWTGEMAFVLVLIGIVFIPVGMYIWMRRRVLM